MYLSPDYGSLPPREEMSRKFVLCLVSADVSEVEQKEETDVAEVQQVKQKGRRGEEVNKQIFAFKQEN